MKKYKKPFGLIVILIFTVILCIYALKWHRIYMDDKLNKTIIVDYITEINDVEFSEYLAETSYAVVYFGITNDAASYNFEWKFKDFILANNLKQAIVYMNVNSLKGDNFSVSLDEKYNSKELRDKNKHLDNAPAVAIYIHGKLTDFVSEKNLAISKVEKLLKKYDIIGE